ncbi:MAG TPA: hypothetical protein VFV68_02180 [Agriterribacter sp.]|nr:hypothetical protein [Agriterribacter sp.]
MERIGVLISKLQELYQDGATPEQIIHVVQMLQTELFLIKQQQANPGRKKIAVMMPGGVALKIENQPSEESKRITEPKPAKQSQIIFDDFDENVVLPVKSKSIPKEKDTADQRFNVLEEVPTLAHQPQARELNEVMGRAELSLNEKLNMKKKELGEKLKEEPLKDIKKAIGVNDRYTFITELFRGDEAMYERSLKTINHFTIYPEAEFWILRELKLKLGWNEEHPAAKQFDQLVRRRFL